MMVVCIVLPPKVSLKTIPAGRSIFDPFPQSIVKNLKPTQHASCLWICSVIIGDRYAIARAIVSFRTGNSPK